MIHCEIDICKPGFDYGSMMERQGQLMVDEWQARYDPAYMARRRADEWVMRTMVSPHEALLHERSERQLRRVQQTPRYMDSQPAIGIWPADQRTTAGSVLSIRENAPLQETDGLFGYALERSAEEPLASQLFGQLEGIADYAAQTDRTVARHVRRGESYSLPQVKVGQREMIVDFAPMPSGSQVFTMRYADRPEAPDGFHLVKKEDNSFLVTAAEVHNLPVLHRPLTLLHAAGKYIDEYRKAFEEQQQGSRLRDVILDSLLSVSGRKAAALLLLSQSFGFVAADNFIVMTDHEGSPLGTLPTNAEVIEIGERAAFIGAYTSMDQSIGELAPVSADDMVLAREGESVRLDLSGEDGELRVDECVTIEAEIPHKDGLRFASSQETSLSVEVERLSVSICNTGAVALRGEQLKTVFVQRARHDDLPFPISHLF